MKIQQCITFDRMCVNHNSYLSQEIKAVTTRYQIFIVDQNSCVYTTIHQI